MAVDTTRGLYDRPTYEIFFEDFKAANPRIDFTSAQVMLTGMVRNNEQATRAQFNTYALLQGKESAGRRGTWETYWNRQDIAKVFARCHVYVPYTGQTQLSELLPIINRDYPIQLTVDDIYDAAIPANPTVPMSLSITMHADNPAFIGVLNLTLGA
jgi:hypothetical protein